MTTTTFQNNNQQVFILSNMISPGAILQLVSSLSGTMSSVLQDVIRRYEEEDELQEIMSSTILHPQEENQESFANWLNLNNQITRSMELRAKELLTIGISTQLCHRRFDTISATPKLSSCIGLSIDKFHLLFSLVEDRLKKAFCHSKSVDESSTHSRTEYADNRFRLFSVLYRLKLACSFRSMEPVFGWSHQVLEEWFNKIIPILVDSLILYHEGILSEDGYCNRRWQAKKVACWSRYHEAEDSLELVSERIQKLHSKNRGIRLIPEDESGIIRGSLGAVDCTYSIRSRVSDSDYDDLFGTDVSENVNDPMYSEYIKHHAWKLSVVTSNSIGDDKELILSISIHPGGSVSDSSAFSFCQRRRIEQ